MILKPRHINLSDKEKEQNFRLNFPLLQTFLDSYSADGGRQGRLESGYINVTVNIPPPPPPPSLLHGELRALYTHNCLASYFTQWEEKKEKSVHSIP